METALEIKERKLQGVPILSLGGKAVMGDAFTLSKKIESAQGSTCARIVIDLTKLKTIDSQLIGILIYGRKLCRENRKDLLLVTPPGFIRDLLKCMRLDRIFTIVDSAEEIPFDAVPPAPSAPGRTALDS